VVEAWCSLWSIFLTPVQREEVARQAGSKRGMNTVTYMCDVHMQKSQEYEKY